jgi:hypothetical protein
MPVGPYKTFGECTAAQMKKGYTKEVAAKVCGKIEANTRKNEMVYAKTIRAKRQAVAKMAQEDELRFLKTGIVSKELRIMEVQYEMENGSRLPYDEDENYRWLWEHGYYKDKQGDT